MKQALLLFGHADHDTFNHRLAEAYTRAYCEHGGVTERIDLASLAFDPVMRHGYRKEQPLEPDLVRARDAIERAHHLVWVFPTYWAAPPAIVRGFVDRLFLPGWAFKYGGGALPEGLLKGRSARVIATMDSPAWWYTLMQHRALHRTMGTATLAFCGLAPVRITTVHGVHGMRPAARDAWCTRMATLAADDLRVRYAERPLRSGASDVLPSHT
jgi:putative NADPH-quinone reductase